MNQTKFLASTCDLLKAQASIGFGLAFYLLRNWREIFKAITKRSNFNRVITFDSHLKTVATKRAASYLIGRKKKNKRAASVARI